jgi:hypothetical protein
MIMVIARNIRNEFIILIIVCIMILIGQWIGFGIKPWDAFVGILLILVISQVSLIIKAALPRVKFPAFAWASLLALVLSMPFMPTAKWFLAQTGQVNFLGTTTCILAFAGISVGAKINTLKKLSWKVFIIALFVFIGTFFGSAVIAHIVLKIQGLI